MIRNLCFEFLCKHKFFYHTPTQAGDIPVAIAAQEGHYEIVETLLKAKANVNHKNRVRFGNGKIYGYNFSIKAWGFLIFVITKCSFFLHIQLQSLVYLHLLELFFVGKCTFCVCFQ